MQNCSCSEGIVQSPPVGGRDLLPNGEGNLHLPPGWGDVPLDAVQVCLDGYAGWLTMEIRPRYRAHYEEALASTRSLLATRQPRGMM